MKRYLAYRDSGLPWLQEAPAHWQTLPNIALFRERNERGYADGELLSVTQDRGIIRQLDLEEKKDSSNDDKSNYKRVYTGDLAYNKMRMWQGAVGYSQFDGIVSPAYVVLCASHDLNIRYYFYMFKTSAYMTYSYRYSYGISDDQLSLRFDEFKRMYSPFPPRAEQDAIVAFLDCKLAEIDRFIAVKQRLIALLQEQRAAIINRAVTRGLDPDAPINPSGIEWLGDVPAHWEVKRLKHVAQIRYGLGQPPREIEGGLPLIRATNVNHGKIVEPDMLFVDPNDLPPGRDSILQAGQIIVVRSGAYTGDSAIIPPQYQGAVAGYDMVVSPRRIMPAFLAYALLSRYVLEGQIMTLRMRAAQPHLNAEELGDVVVLLPPTHEEQREIAAHIEAESQRVDMATSQAEREIELIKEYRTTLISDAVTGKIDVRAEVAEEVIA